MGLDVESYLLLWPMGGLRLTEALDDVIDVHLQVEAGALLQRNPAIRSTGPGAMDLVDGRTTGAFAYSVAGGWTLDNRVCFALRYLHGGSSAVQIVSTGATRNSGTRALEPAEASILATDQPAEVLEFSVGIIL